MTWVWWVAVGVALLLATTAVVLAVLNRRALHREGIATWPATSAAGPAGEGPTEIADAARTLVAFVANPTKAGVPALRDAVVQACAARYLPEPMWLETTAEDPGVGQTREAVERGCRLVVAIGGDGTVRAVAEGLAGTDVPMGLIPQGTGNLLARNLDLPINDVDALVRIALSGTDRRIDVGWLTVVRGIPGPDAGESTTGNAGEGEGTTGNANVGGTQDRDRAAGPVSRESERIPPEGEPGGDHIFLVISGLGFDAAMVADTDEVLKAKVGWIAYFVAGIKHLHARRMRLQMSLDESPWYNVRLRSLLIGNCGKLPGGITLLPDAVLDDGWLDVGAIDTRVGLLGWGQLFGEVALQRFGVRTRLPNKAGRIDHARAREVRVRAREPQQIQVDGDIVGFAYEVAARIEPLSLTVRVDAPE
jgi:diacylglycerol kinase family enzyme